MRLPELTYGEPMNLLLFFGTDLEGAGSPQIKATNRSGKSVAVHLHPSRKFLPESLSSTLRHLEVSREEFFAWDRMGRKRR